MQTDLSHRIETGMPTYPGDPPVRVEPHTTHARDGYRVGAVWMGSHAGTHIDAPAHVVEDGRTLDSYPLDRFTFAAIRVDCTEMGEREPITDDRVPDHEADLVVFRTDWSAHWGTERYLDHPFLTPEAAATCAERGYAVGIDALSPDPTPTRNAAADEPKGVPAHHALLGADELVVENLHGLDGLPDRFELRAYPLALGGDGAPVRAVGVVE